MPEARACLKKFHGEDHTGLGDSTVPCLKACKAANALQTPEKHELASPQELLLRMSNWRYRIRHSLDRIVLSHFALRTLVCTALLCNVTLLNWSVGAECVPWRRCGSTGRRPPPRPCVLYLYCLERLRPGAALCMRGHERSCRFCQQGAQDSAEEDDRLQGPRPKAALCTCTGVERPPGAMNEWTEVVTTALEKESTETISSKVRSGELYSACAVLEDHCFK